MKKLVTAYIILMSFGVFANTPGDLFTQGNEAYKKGDYQTAVAKYEKALQSGQQASELFYNLANAYYKLNKIAPSIYYYEKALRLNPGDEDIAYNLALANKMKIDKLESLPENFFLRQKNKIARWFTTDFWAKLTVFFGFLGLAVFITFLFNKKTGIKRITFAGMFITMFLWLFSLYFANYSKHLDDFRSAIVFVPETNLLNEPNLTADKVITLHEGTKVRVIKTEGDWLYVKLPDGKKAWLTTNDVRVIE